MYGWQAKIYLVLVHIRMYVYSVYLVLVHIKVYVYIQLKAARYYNGL